MEREIRKLGEILVDEGVIDVKTLEESLAMKGGVKLGRYLVDNQIANEHDIVSAISRQLGMEVFVLTKMDIRKEALGYMSLEAMTAHHMIPVDVVDGKLLVAMTDPLDSSGYDEASRQSPYPVKAMICTRSEFERAYSAFCGAGGGMEMAGDDMERTPVSGAGFKADVDLDSGTFSDGDGDDSEVSKELVKLLRRAVAQRASDIHVRPGRSGYSVALRVDGKIRHFKSRRSDILKKCVSKCLVLSKIDIAISTRPQDGGFSMLCDGRDYSVRTSVLPTVYGGNLVLRILGGDMGKFTLSRLGMPAPMHQEFKRALGASNGMIVLTGPTGSGKSTTLYSALVEAASPDENTITIEDPVEYRVDGVQQVQVNPKAGLTFASGLRAILRQDPDVILLGEIRDAETAEIAVRAALTGHKVLTTIHANDAPGVVVRLLEMGIEPYIVASVLRMCVSQRLVRKSCPDCRIKYDPDPYLVNRFGLTLPEGGLTKGGGCSKCGGTGFSGRVAVFESMVVDKEAREAILKGAGLVESLTASGCLMPMADDAVSKVLSGITTLEEVAKSVLS